MKFIALLFCAVITLPALAAPPKQPWQWTDAERIAVRTDRTLAAKRVQAYRIAENAEAQEKQTSSKNAASLTDVIDGSRNPELFLSTELFETAVTLGLVIPDNWQETWAAGLSRSGLPADFWQRLPAISPFYVDDIRTQFRLVEEGKTPEHRARSNREIAALAPSLCRDRAAALAAAREAFGPALDRFLYETVAAGKSLTYFDEEQSRDRLESHARGCR